jgi:hypothetical protein
MASEQGGPLPHAHRPSAPQESAERGSHAVHAPPPAPQAATLAVRQAPVALQQPAHAAQPAIGSPSTTVTKRSRPRLTTTRDAPSPTSAPLRKPSTFTSSVWLSSASGSSTRTEVVAASNSPGVSGRNAGPNVATSSTEPP